MGSRKDGFYHQCARWCSGHQDHRQHLGSGIVTQRPCNFYCTETRQFGIDYNNAWDQVLRGLQDLISVTAFKYSANAISSQRRAEDLAGERIRIPKDDGKILYFFRQDHEIVVVGTVSINRERAPYFSTSTTQC